MASWKVEIKFDTKMIEAEIDNNMQMRITKFEPSIELEENVRMINAINAVVYFLRNNSGTRFEVEEQP
jgi:hypothetical protein